MRTAVRGLVSDPCRSEAEGAGLRSGARPRARRDQDQARVGGTAARHRSARGGGPGGRARRGGAGPGQPALRRPGADPLRRGRAARADGGNARGAPRVENAAVHGCERRARHRQAPRGPGVVRAARLDARTVGPAFPPPRPRFDGRPAQDLRAPAALRRCHADRRSNPATPYGPTSRRRPATSTSRTSSATASRSPAPHRAPSTRNAAARSSTIARCPFCPIPPSRRGAILAPCSHLFYSRSQRLSRFHSTPHGGRSSVTAPRAWCTSNVHPSSSTMA